MNVLIDLKNCSLVHLWEMGRERGATHVDMPPTKVKLAFTLAETLITLGIIGVVAAMTIPSLITNYNKHITEVRLQKFYSLFNQAIKLSVVENGEVEGWSDYWNAATNIVDSDGNVLENADVVDSAFEKYLAPYMKVMTKKRVKNAQNNNETQLLYFLADGSAFSYRSIDVKDISFYPKNPEKCLSKEHNSGICSFEFLFCPNINSANFKYHYQAGLEPYMYRWNGQKALLYRGSSYSCSGSARYSGRYCTEMIKLNGWKIPDDYPQKISY